MPRAVSGDASNHGHLDAAVACLWLLTPLTATLSLVIVCVSMTTNQWLHTEEKMANSNYNGTGDREYLSKYTVSGLWTLCYTNPGEKDLQCFNIDYFPREEYSPDPNDSTMAIPYAVTKSAVFFILATLCLCLGEFCCLFGHFARQRRLCTFISGVVFIISGLLMLIGLVMYISIFKAEIGSKLRPRSQLQPPLFTYRYGFSFLLVVSGFMASETAGTCAIFLYIYWHQKEWLRKRHEMHLHRRKLSSSSLLLAAAEAAGSGAVGALPPHAGAAHALPPPHRPPPPPPPAFPCRRHPHPYYAPPPHRHPPLPAASCVCPGVSPTMHQRRFYLDRGAGDEDSQEVSPCLSRSHQNLPAVSSCVPENNMRDIGVSASFYSFPAGGGAGGPPFHHCYLPRDECGGASSSLDLRGPPPRPFPRDATTNTVSTTADINSCEGGDAAADANDDEDDDYSPSIQHEHEFVTFDLDEPRSAAAAAAAAAHADEQRRKEFSLETLRRTTPV